MAFLEVPHCPGPLNKPSPLFFSSILDFPVPWPRLTGYPEFVGAAGRIQHSTEPVGQSSSLLFSSYHYYYFWYGPPNKQWSMAHARPRVLAEARRRRVIDCRPIDISRVLFISHSISATLLIESEWNALRLNDECVAYFVDVFARIDQWKWWGIGIECSRKIQSPPRRGCFQVWPKIGMELLARGFFPVGPHFCQRPPSYNLHKCTASAFGTFFNSDLAIFAGSSPSLRSCGTANPPVLWTGFLGKDGQMLPASRLFIESLGTFRKCRRTSATSHCGYLEVQKVEFRTKREPEVQALGNLECWGERGEGLLLLSMIPSGGSEGRGHQPCESEIHPQSGSRYGFSREFLAGISGPMKNILNHSELFHLKGFAKKRKKKRMLRNMNGVSDTWNSASLVMGVGPGPLT